MRIGILGTGNLAVSLGTAWANAEHSIVLTGRNPARAHAAATRIGPRATAVEPADLAGSIDALVIAVRWDGLADALDLVSGEPGSLRGLTVIDCTNPIDLSSGRLTLDTGSAAELVARLTPGANVVKALHLFAGASWPFIGSPGEAPVVAICGDDPSALEQVASLVRDLGGRTAVVGRLDAARQLEESAGFVMRVVAAGMNPMRAVPNVDIGA